MTNGNKSIFSNNNNNTNENCYYDTNNNDMISKQPDDGTRLLLWKKHIGQKCQQILVTTHDNSYFLEYERVPIGAMSFFYYCLLDRVNDALSESLDKHVLKKFVCNQLTKFPKSEVIQSMGCQILTHITRETIPSLFSDSSLLLSSFSSTSSPLRPQLPLLLQEQEQQHDRSFSLLIGESFDTDHLIYKSLDCSAMNITTINRDDDDDGDDGGNEVKIKTDTSTSTSKNTFSSIFKSIFTKPCSCVNQTLE